MGSRYTSRVVIVDDHAILCEGVAALLSQAGFQIVGQGSSGEQAVRLAETLHPDLILLDVTLDGLNGIEAARRINRLPGARPAILMLSMHARRELCERALSAGARGYLLKSADRRELMEAIEVVLRGELYFPELSRSSPAFPGVHETEDVEVTSREMEILALVAEGLTSKEIAAQLGLSPKTVINHRANIMQKLSITTTAGLVRYYLTARRS